MKGKTFKTTISSSKIKEIDQLVLKGVYKSPPDFIKIAICNELKSQNGRIDLSDDLFGLNTVEIVTDIYDLDWSDFKGSGIASLNSKYFEKALTSGKKLTINFVGILIINKNVSPKLAADTLKHVKVYGFIFASTEVKRIIDRL